VLIEQAAAGIAVSGGAKNVQISGTSGDLYDLALLGT
jgi:hypothetical protein